MTRIVDRDLDGLRQLALRMGSLCEAILAKSLDALWTRDPLLAAEVRKDDLEIDRLDIEIDEAVIKVLALQSPVARDLRDVIAIKTMATDLERVGDLARNIAKSAERLSGNATIEIPAQLESLAEQSRRLLRRSLDCFADSDPAEARLVLEADDQIDIGEEKFMHAELEEIRARPETSAQAVDLILVAKNLERVADHATNIAEDVILATDAENLKHASKLSR